MIKHKSLHMFSKGTVSSPSDLFSDSADAAVVYCSRSVSYSTWNLRQTIGQWWNVNSVLYATQKLRDWGGQVVGRIGLYISMENFNPTNPEMQ